MLFNLIFNLVNSDNSLTEKDIEEALKAKNFLSNENGKRLFVIKELERLGLLDPKPKKKKYSRQVVTFYKIEDAGFWEQMVKTQGCKDDEIVPVF